MASNVGADWNDARYSQIKGTILLLISSMHSNFLNKIRGQAGQFTRIIHHLFFLPNDCYSLSNRDNLLSKNVWCEIAFFFK